MKLKINQGYQYIKLDKIQMNTISILRKLSFYIYIYVSVCVCVCVCARNAIKTEPNRFLFSFDKFI